MVKYKIFFQLTLIFILISGIIYSQNYIENHKIKKNELLYFVPKKEHLVYTSFGFKPVVADLLWLRGVSYFMFHLDRDNDYKYLYGMFSASINLDPRFKQVYRDAMVLLLSDKEHYPEAEKIILAGVNNLPQDWEIYYMAGMLYAYYIKDELKSLQYLERCWGLIPRTERYSHELESVNILIRAITEKKNDKTGLILYWVNKYKDQMNNDTKDFCVLQIRKYVSSYMEEKLNNTLNLKVNEDEKKIKDQEFKDHVNRFMIFFETHKLGAFIDVPREYLFSKTDAFGYPWVYSENQKKLYSFGNAHEYLSRKINLFNVQLWGKLEKYLVIPSIELVNYHPSERVLHVKLKPEFSEFPAFEDIFKEDNNWLKSEYPLLPTYDRAQGRFQVPKFQDLATISTKYK